MNKLLKYEFWKDKEASYYQFFSSGLARENSAEKRKYFAAQILKTPSRPIHWLDVGSGEGQKVSEIIQNMRQVEPAVKIELVAIEPSAFAVATLREKMAQLNEVSLEVRNKRFSTDTLQPNTYDCVSFFHSAYYLASERKDFEELYKAAYASLRRDGLLLIQAVDENADFQQLQKSGYGNRAAYSDWAQGRHAFSLLKELWQVEQKEYPTHFDATDFLTQENYSPELESRFLQFYSFVMQVENAYLSVAKRQNFINEMRRLAKADNGKYYLNFNDIIISVRKK